jgi:hypothetical protein
MFRASFDLNLFTKIFPFEKQGSAIRRLKSDALPAHQNPKTGWYLKATLNSHRVCSFPD